MLLITKKKKRKEKWQNKEKPPVWKRFTIDDIFCLWDTKKEDIELFIEKANAYHPTHIKFSGEISEIDSWTQQCTKRWVKGWSYARICTIITRIKISRPRFMEISEVQGQCMAGPVQNTAVCRVYDELLR